MKHTAIISALLLASATAAHGTQWPYKSLEQLLREADAVVIGSIDSADGRTELKNPEASLAHTWNSRLTVKTVLKGKIELGAITVQWDEIRIGGQTDYQPKEQRIWILNTLTNNGPSKTFSTSGRPDTVLSTNRLEEVTRLLKKGNIEPGH